MQILFTAFEADPFMKTGGLADVAGSMPAAVKAAGGKNVDIRVMLPKYSGIPSSFTAKMKDLGHFYVDLAWRHEYCGIFALKHKGITFYFLDSEKYFYRSNLYGDYDDAERMAFFSKACLEACLHIDDFAPDVIHSNDWHTALVSVYLRECFMATKLANARTVFTIHNLKFQGIYDPFIIGDILGLHETPADAQLRQWKGYGCCTNFLMGGCIYADAITTVSPTYAQEICTLYYGEGLDWLFSQRKSILSGILNGIDYAAWDPKTDAFLKDAQSQKENTPASMIPSDAKNAESAIGIFPDTANSNLAAKTAAPTDVDHSNAKAETSSAKSAAPNVAETTFAYSNYSAKTLEDKVKNKMALQKELGLKVDANIPLFAIISRLTEQKGLDLVTYNLPHIAQADMQLVVLGIGDHHFEEAFGWYAQQYPDKISAQIKFDNSLSHKLYAAADVMMIPSRFEPCGLTQLIAMRYGTLPLVRETGGLADTVDDSNGFSFLTFNADDMKYALDCALDTWHHKPKVWRKKQLAGMKADYSWKKSAAQYLELYENLLK